MKISVMLDEKRDRYLSPMVEMTRIGAEFGFAEGSWRKVDLPNDGLTENGWGQDPSTEGPTDGTTGVVFF